MAMIRKTVKVGERDLIIETGRMAKQADGAAVVRYGDTMILATSVSAKDRKDVDFLPLTVEYWKENFFAAGRIPGGYFRREGKLTEKETLTSRIVDRSCRPLFPDGYAYETQVIVSVISFDKDAEPDVLSLCAASASLAVSDIPFNGPIANSRCPGPRIVPFQGVGREALGCRRHLQGEQSDCDSSLRIHGDFASVPEGRHRSPDRTDGSCLEMAGLRTRTARRRLISSGNPLRSNQRHGD